MAESPLLQSLRAAVEAAPDDVPLRLHLAELLLAEGGVDESVQHVAAALQRQPTSAPARALMARVVAAPQPTAADPESTPTGPEPMAADGQAAAFDWRRAEQDLGEVVPPMFVEGEPEPSAAAWDVERSGVRLDDVGGMVDVKRRLDAAFLAPLRNPELRRLYGKSLRGGLLLYGPPGCGKTFLARAIAGELGARFLSVSLHEVLDMYIGASERNLHEFFELGRRSAPCVLFFDELDAIGQRRSQLRSNAMRNTVNQLLTEMDDVGGSNEGLFLMGATNAPWDVDVALRRPGRFDRMLLVLPPDEAAREAILRYHLKDRPVAGVDVRRLARRADGCSGADLAHVCETAAERALLDAAASGTVRMISTRDLEAALREVRPSTGPWFETARNVVLFANEGGTYDELRAYLKQRRLL